MNDTSGNKIDSEMWRHCVIRKSVLKSMKTADKSASGAADLFNPIKIQ